MGSRKEFGANVEGGGKWREEKIGSRNEDKGQEKIRIKRRWLTGEKRKEEERGRE